MFSTAECDGRAECDAEQLSGVGQPELLVEEAPADGPADGVVGADTQMLLTQPMEDVDLDVRTSS